MRKILRIDDCMKRKQKLSDILILTVRSWAKQNKFSKSSLAVKSGLADRTLKYLWSENWNPTIKTLQKIEALIPDNFIALPPVKKKVKKKQGGVRTNNKNGVTYE